MQSHDLKIETRVGFFVLIGLAVVAATVVYFGRLGRGWQGYYEVQIDFPNASGLLAGADVLLGGARIGYVARPPGVLPAMQGVAVDLKIRDDVQLPSVSHFVVGSSGLLGNRFVDVIVPPGADMTAHIAPGTVIEGQREAGLEDLKRDSSEIMADVRKAVTTLNATLDRLSNTAFSEKSLEDLRETIANLKEGSASFTQIGKATKDLEAAAADARKVMSSARSGSGPLPMLLNDSKAANDLRAILYNVRRNGVLWYKDSYQQEGRQN